MRRLFQGRVAPVVRPGRGLKLILLAIMPSRNAVAPVVRPGRGLKLQLVPCWPGITSVAPVVRPGRGLKRQLAIPGPTGPRVALVSSHAWASHCLLVVKGIFCVRQATAKPWHNPLRDCYSALKARPRLSGLYQLVARCGGRRSPRATAGRAHGASRRSKTGCPAGVPANLPLCESTTHCSAILWSGRRLCVISTNHLLPPCYFRKLCLVP